MRPHGARPMCMPGIAVGAAFALIVFCALTVGLSGPAGGAPPRAPTPAAPRPRRLESQSQTIYVDDQAASARETEEVSTKGVGRRCQGLTEKNHYISSRVLEYLECKGSYLVFIARDCSIYIALAAIVLWHLLRHFWCKNIIPFARNASLGVLVFNIFYHEGLPDFMHNNPFTSSCTMLCFESAFFKLLELILHKLEKNDDNAEEDRTTNPRSKLLNYRIVNKYQKLSSPFSSTFLLFLCQLTLGLYYVYDLNSRTSKRGWGDVVVWRWFIGLCLCNLAGENEVGTEFVFDFWLNLREALGPLADKRTRICEIWARGIMSAIVNQFFRRIILGTAPVLLGVEGPLDFIKDCLAVFFITKLDDLEDPVGFRTELERMKKEGGSNFWEILHNTFAEDEPPAEEGAAQECRPQVDSYAKKEDLEKLQEKVKMLERTMEERAALACRASIGGS